MDRVELEGGLTVEKCTDCELCPRRAAAGVELRREGLAGNWSAEKWSWEVASARKCRRHLWISSPRTNRPTPPLVARHRSTKRHIQEFVVQYERHRASYEREGRDDEAVNIDYVEDHAVMDAACSRAFRGSPTTTP